MNESVGEERQPAEMAGHRAEWDERYAGSEQVWSGRANGTLVALVGGLKAGTALDVGCGDRADAVWLAAHGWHATACDVSRVALDRAKAVADQARVQVLWQEAGLLGLPRSGAGFDLVSVQYPALRRTTDRAAERALSSAVAPGGILLVVHHADVDVELARANGFEPADYVQHEDVLAVLGDGWRVELDEIRPRGQVGGGGGHHKDDLILLARRVPTVL